MPQKITERQFTEAVATWADQVIKPKIPSATAPGTRGVIAAILGAIRVRPNLLTSMALKYMPFLESAGIFANGAVDSELLRVMLDDFFKETKEFNFNTIIPTFPFVLSAEDAHVLSKKLVAAEGAVAIEQTHR